MSEVPLCRQEPAVLLLLRNRKVRAPTQREFFVDNLLVRIHFIIVVVRWTGLAPWEFEFPFFPTQTILCRPRAPPLIVRTWSWKSPPQAISSTVFGVSGRKWSVQDLELTRNVACGYQGS